MLSKIAGVLLPMEPALPVQKVIENTYKFQYAFPAAGAEQCVGRTFGKDSAQVWAGVEDPPAPPWR